MHRAIFDAIPDAVVIVDPDGTIMMANRNAYRMFGYAPPALIGQPVEMLVPPELREPHQRHRRAYQRDPRERPMGVASMELMGLRRDGSRFPVEIALSPIRIAHGPQVLASIRDISRTSMARRVERKSRHDATLLDIGQRVVDSGSEDRVLHDVACELSDSAGVGPVWLLLRDAASRRVRGVGLTTPPPDWLATEAPVLFDGLVRGEVLHAHDGRLGSARLPARMRSGVAFPLVLEDRSIPAALTAFSYDADAFDTDLERLLHTTASLLSAMLQRQRSSEALAHAQRLEAIGQLTGGVAHDFNNLLTVVSGNLQMLEDRLAGDDAESGALLDAAVRAVDQGAALTRKLLSFAGRQRLRPAVVALPQQVRELERLVRATLGERIRLRIAADAAVPPVRVDPALLDSAVLNLVLNARDAIDGAGEVEIAVGDAGREPDAPPGAYVALAVRDTGCGMSELTLARACEPFYTTKPPGRGTGLGLSMVYGFIRQSGGHVRLRSRPGEGATVTLYLPAAGEAEAETLAARAPLAGGSEVVLVVEDDPAVRATVEASLKSLGYHVIATASPQDALECVESLADIALLFTDLTLEGPTTGVQLAQQARRLRPDLAVLLTSGYPDAGEGGRLDDFALLPKPYHKEDLARAVRAALAAMRQPMPITS